MSPIGFYGVLLGFYWILLFSEHFWLFHWIFFLFIAGLWWLFDGLRPRNAPSQLALRGNKTTALSLSLHFRDDCVSLFIFLSVCFYLSLSRCHWVFLYALDFVTDPPQRLFVCVSHPIQVKKPSVSLAVDCFLLFAHVLAIAISCSLSLSLSLSLSFNARIVAQFLWPSVVSSIWPAKTNDRFFDTDFYFVFSSYFAANYLLALTINPHPSSAKAFPPVFLFRIHRFVMIRNVFSLKKTKLMVVVHASVHSISRTRVCLVFVFVFLVWTWSAIPHTP